MSTPKEVFNKAFALVRNPETWTKDAAARDFDDNPVFADDINACRWCSVGALHRFDVGIGAKTVHRILNTEAERAGYEYECIADFNNNNTHETVVALWESVGRKMRWLDEKGEDDS